MKKLLTLLALITIFCTANAQYVVPRGLPSLDTRQWVRLTKPGGFFMADSLYMSLSHDTTMKPLYPALAYWENTDIDSTWWIWDLVRWKKINGSSSVTGNQTWQQTLDESSFLNRDNFPDGSGYNIEWNNFNNFVINPNNLEIPYLGGGADNNLFLTTDAFGNVFLAEPQIPLDSNGFFGTQDWQSTLDYGSRLRHDNRIHGDGYNFDWDSSGYFSLYSGNASSDNQTGAYGQLYADFQSLYFYTQDSTEHNGSEILSQWESALMYSWDSSGNSAYYSAIGNGNLKSYANVSDTIDAPLINLTQYPNSDATQVLSTNSAGDLIFVTASGITDITGTDNFGFHPIISGTTTKDIQVSTLLTLGSVPFIGTDGALRENNPKFFWDSTNARLGIGKNTPLVTLNVRGQSVFENNYTLNGDLFNDRMMQVNDTITGDNPTADRYPRAFFSQIVTAGAVNINGPTTELIAFQGQAKLAANITTREAIGGLGRVYTTGANTLGRGVGLEGQITISADQVATQMVGVEATFYHLGGSITVPDLYYFRTRDTNKNLVPTTINARRKYGMYIDTVEDAWERNYGIFQAGNGVDIFQADSIYMPNLQNYVSGGNAPVVLNATTGRLELATGGVGSGTVTSVGSGYGLTGGAITTSGTLLVDTVTLDERYLQSVVSNDLTWSVLDSLNTPPVSPTTGDVYEVGTVPTGAFVGHAKEIAEWSGSAWTFSAATIGDLLFNDGTSIVSKWTGSVWLRVSKLPAFIGGNAGLTNPFIGTLNNTVFSIRTNNSTRFSLAANGTPTFFTLTGAAAGVMGLSTTGVASNVQKGTGILISSSLISADTFALATRAWRQKLADSLGLLLIRSMDTVNVSNVLSYGADSTGSSDATAAFNNAINAAVVNGKMRVYVPHGTYKISITYLKSGGTATNNQGIQLRDNIEFFGDGKGKTILTIGNNSTITTSNSNIFPIINGYNVSNCYVHDIEISGNKTQQGQYTANPYTNPAGYFADTSNRWSTSGIQFFYGSNNRVSNVYVHDCQLEGYMGMYTTNLYVGYSKFFRNGSSGTEALRGCSGNFEYIVADSNASDQLRVDSCILGISFSYCQGTNAQANASATNWFAGVYIAGSSHVHCDNLYLSDNSAYGYDNASDSTYKDNILTNSWIEYNGNAGIAAAYGRLQISNNNIINNGKTHAGATDTKSTSGYNPAAIAVITAVDLTVAGNNSVDTVASGNWAQIWFMKIATGGTGYYRSNITDNYIKGVADTAHIRNGNLGANNFLNNTAYKNTNLPVFDAPDTYAWIYDGTYGNGKFGQVNLTSAVTGTLPFGNGGTGQSSYTDGQLLIGNSSTGGLSKATLTAGSNITITNGNGTISIASSASAGTALSAITPATGTNTINNADLLQEWQWNTLTVGSGMKLSSSSTTATSSAQALFVDSLYGANGTALQTTYAAKFSNTHTGTTSTNIAGYFTASGGASANYGIQADAPGIASTAAIGIQLANTTASTVGTTVQMPASLEWSGSAWKSNATAASQVHKWKAEVRPVTGAASTTSSLAFAASVAGGAYGDLMFLNSGGVLSLGTGNTSTTALAAFKSPFAAFGGSEPAITQTLLISRSGGASASAYQYGVIAGVGLTNTAANIAAAISTAGANIGVTNPNASGSFYGAEGSLSAGGSAVTTSPLMAGGVHAYFTWAGTGTTVAMAKAAGVDAEVNMATANTKTLTLLYGVWSHMSGSNAGGGVFTNYSAFRADSITNGFVTNSPFGLDIVGSNYINNIGGKTKFGDATRTAPTSLVTIAAGTATANTASLEILPGTLETTIRTGLVENNNSFYVSNSALNRTGIGGAIADFTSDVNNSGTGETDLLTYTTKASTLAATGEKLIFEASGTFNDLTATSQLQFYYGGTNIGNTGALTVSATGGWSARVIVIRTGSSTARALVTVTTPGASTALYTTETDITSLTFTNTQIIKITGTAGGASGGSSDITAKLGSVFWFPAANN